MEAGMIRAVGLMSGTSMDGVDAALIETDGQALRVTLGGNGRLESLGPVLGSPYTAEQTALLARAKEEAKAHLQVASDRGRRPGCLAEAERLVTESHAEAVERLLAAEGLSRHDIAVVGFHGQTVVHRPGQGLTVQIGDGQALADRLGIPVVFDLRAADVAAGGEGAPLVPVFHRALAEACGYELPLAVLNIGGVANVTFIGPGDALVGFDTGPGNALLNDLVTVRLGQPYDEDGVVASRGRADPALLAWMLSHPFFARPAPKSLDRDAFTSHLVGTLPTEDAAATLAAFTVGAVKRACEQAPASPRRWIVGGGGARNAEIMRLLRAALAAEVLAADELGWSGDFLEAQAFAYLAARSLDGLPLTFPSTTGARAPMPGGVLARPR